MVKKTTQNILFQFSCLSKIRKKYDAKMGNRGNKYIHTQNMFQFSFFTSFTLRSHLEVVSQYSINYNMPWNY